jgi:hypothetical protein
MNSILELQGMGAASPAQADSLPFSTTSWLCPPFTINTTD